MKTLLPEELKQAEKIVTLTTPTRKTITLYKKNDEGLALFRVTAMNNIQELIIRKVKGLEKTKKLTNWLEFWNDGSHLGNAIQSLNEQIDSIKI